MLVKLVAINRVDYGKNRIKAGAEFEASVSDASVLVTIGLAKLKPPEQAKPLSVPEEVSEKATRRKYKRRDMTAEDSGSEDGEE